MTLLSASLYAADPFRLAEEIEKVSSRVESFHLDIMDGRFAPEYGLTTRVIRELKGRTHIPLDVHLMIDSTLAMVRRFAEMGVRSIAIHLESGTEFREAAAIARSNGVKAYAALQPTTPVAKLDTFREDIDGCLLLTAPAGGGYFDSNAFQRLSERPSELYTVADGRILFDHFNKLDELGVDVAVVGAALFNKVGRETARHAD